jgi:hypothetical protein
MNKVAAASAALALNRVIERTPSPHHCEPSEGEGEAIQFSRCGR